VCREFRAIRVYGLGNIRNLGLLGFREFMVIRDFREFRVIRV
jgi:hypothetical protein